MARLPKPGGDSGDWGNILNDYLSQSLNLDGTIKDDSVGASQIQDGAITKTDIGLGNVDNTADTAKPISATQQAALDTKADTSALSAKLNTADLDTQAAAKITTSGTATQTALNAAITVALSGIADPFHFDATRLRAFRAALGKRATTPVDILFIGDSNTEGYGSIGSNQSYRWLECLRDGLRSRFQPAGIVGGEGYVASFYSSATMTDRAVVTTGTFTPQVYGGLGRRLIGIDSASSVTMGFTGTGIDIVYSEGIAGATMGWKIDGGSETTFSTNNAINTCGHIAQVRSLTSGVHTVTIRNTAVSGSNKVFLEGIMAYDGDETAGIRVWDGAHTAYRSGDFVANGGLDWAADVAMIQPDLVFITLGTNDYGLNGSQVTPALLKTNLQTLITNIRSKCTVAPSIVLVISPEPYENSTVLDTWDNYRAKLFEVASADGNITVLDLARTMGSFAGNVDPFDFVDNTDSIHYTRAGHQALADAALQMLTIL